jgi:hypothetical protein
MKATMRRARIFVGLLHYPMYNKRGEVITTAATNLDVHDIARAARTYDVERFVIIHPSPGQREIVETMTAYWQRGYGRQYNADRNEALRRVALYATLEEAQSALAELTGMTPALIATDAGRYPRATAYQDMRRLLCLPGCYLLLFGTGWGMQRELVSECDYVLPPVGLVSDYNHLSVRSAAAIILDRLLGEAWFLESKSSE